MSRAFIETVVIPFMKIGLVLNIMLGIVAYTTLLERKVIAFMQVRLGPRRVGFHGILQPIADVLKLFIKEDITPAKADRFLFLLAPVLTLVPALIAIAVIPFSGESVEIFGYTITPWIADLNIGVLYLIAVSSLGVYGIVLGGWASNSKYPLLGALRSAAQMISYEVPLGFSIIGVLMLAGTASMTGIVHAQEQAHVWFFVPQALGFFIFFICGVAETNRAPFDMPEAETELVAGFHTEYSGMKFSFFFLAEYISMIVISAIGATLFLGGWLRPFPNVDGLEWLNLGLPPFLAGLMWFGFKVFIILFMYLWLRATYPRYRYDQLMAIGWKWLLPLSLLNVLGTALVLLLMKG